MKVISSPSITQMSLRILISDFAGQVGQSDARGLRVSGAHEVQISETCAHLETRKT